MTQTHFEHLLSEKGRRKQTNNSDNSDLEERLLTSGFAS